jgi:excisionase family DNA binding protein
LSIAEERDTVPISDCQRHKRILMMPPRSRRSKAITLEKGGVSGDERSPQPPHRTRYGNASLRDVSPRRSGRSLPKYYSIKAVAEALDVSSRTVRRWIANGTLIVHRVDGVVRIAEGDLQAFLALHREG